MLNWNLCSLRVVTVAQQPRFGGSHPLWRLYGTLYGETTNGSLLEYLSLYWSWPPLLSSCIPCRWVWCLLIVELYERLDWWIRARYTLWSMHRNGKQGDSYNPSSSSSSPHKMWRWKWRENKQYVWFLCTSDWLISKPMMKGRKRNSVRGLVNQSVLTNFAVYSGTMVYRIKWNEMKWKLLIGSQLTPGKKKKHWWPYGTRSVPNTLVY